MSKTKAELEKLIKYKLRTLEQLRETFDRADANDIHTQGSVAQAISKLVTEVETLEELQESLKNDG